MTTETVLTDKQIQQAVQCLVAEVSIDGETLRLKNVNGCIRALEQAVLQSPEVQNLIEAAQEFSDLYGWLWDTTDDGGFLSPEGVKRYDAAHDKLQAALCILQGKPLPYDPSLDDDFGDEE